MPITSKIIEDVVRNVVKSELIDVKSDLVRVKTKLEKVETELEKLHNKVDHLEEVVSDFAGEVQKFDQEQVLLSHRTSIHNDRPDKLETKVFGSPTTVN